MSDKALSGGGAAMFPFLILTVVLGVLLFGKRETKQETTKPKYEVRETAEEPVGERRVSPSPEPSFTEISQTDETTSPASESTPSSAENDSSNKSNIGEAMINLQELATNKADWPKEVVLKENRVIALAYGSSQLKAGTKLRVQRVTPSGAEVVMGTQTTLLPINATDLLKRVAAKRNGTL